MKIIACDFRQAGPILAIFNDAILNSTALYDYEPRTPAFMEEWFRAKEAGHYPVFGAVDDDGALAGFASYGPFRHFPAYKYTVEHSVYVHPEKRGRGVGKALLRELIAAATVREYHTLVGAIDSANAASIALHAGFGFAPCGTIRQAGFKFGRWLDFEFHQLLLPTPDHPVDG